MDGLVEEFTELYGQWAEALRAKRASWFESIEDARFTYIAADGTRKDRAAHLLLAARGARGELSTTVESAEAFGGVVIVNGTHQVRAEVPDDAGLSQQLVERMSDGFTVRFSSVWTASRRLLHHHTTPIRPA